MTATMILVDERGAAVFEGRRVTRRSPCPVCGKDTWCLADPDRGLALCPRVSGGRKVGSAGFLHSVGGAVPEAVGCRRPPEDETPRLENAEGMQARFLRQGAARVGMLALSLGLSRDALERLGAGWNGSAWTFPMRNSREEIVGFRTRLENGRKLAIKGSRSGLFIPSGRKRSSGDIVWIVEGPTDAAAMIDMGMNAIGRPSCRGSEQEIRRWTRGMNVVVVADHDLPGVEGAEALIQTLRGSAISVRMVLPPMGMKDAREVLNHGGSSSDWLALLGDSRNQRNSNGRQA